MNILLLISNHCETCARAESQLKSIKNNSPLISCNVEEIDSYHDKRIKITPAWIVDGELYSYGLVDEKKLIAKITPKLKSTISQRL